jgi:hypothetical protein
MTKLRTRSNPMGHTLDATTGKLAIVQVVALGLIFDPHKHEMTSSLILELPAFLKSAEWCMVNSPWG